MPYRTLAAATPAQQPLIDAVTGLRATNVRALLAAAPGSADVAVAGVPLLTVLLELRHSKAQNAARIATFRALLEGGADPNVQGSASKSFGAAPVVVAIAQFNGRFFSEPMLEHGLALDVRDARSGQTLLHYCAERSDEGWVTRCLSAGLGADAVDLQGRTSLHAAAAPKYGQKASMFKRLVAAGAPLEARDAGGATALLLASRYGDAAMVKALLALGADPNAQDDAGNGALHYAAMGRGEGSLSPIDAVATLEFLLAKRTLRSDVKARNAAGETLLHAAARHGTRATIAFLRKRGLSPADTDARGAKPADVATRRELREVLAK